MTKEENLQAGIAAARTGDLARAASFFAKVVKEDPGSEQGWFLLASCLSDPERRKFCYRRVLALNPGNTQAARLLDQLTMDSLLGSSASPPASAPSPIPAAPQEPPQSSTVPPFHAGEATPEEAPAPEPRWYDQQAAPAEPVETVREGPPTPYRPPEIPVTPREDMGGEPERKSSSKSLVWISAFALILIFCGLGTAYLMLTGQLDDLPSIRLFNRAPPAVQYPTTTPFAPTPTPTTTPDPSILPTPKPTVEYTPLFEEAPCPFVLYANVDVKCGYVVVPEDRTGDPSHTIRLAVAVYKSTSDSPEPDPVVFLQGGPGAEAVQLSANAFSALVAPFLSKRDFIVFDQRGTGLSDPSLQCEELTKTFSQDIHGLIDVSTRELVYSTSFRSCGGLISILGINVNAYTTLESAADFRDILGLLGYQQANLYGASYGTRLALVIMREYPEIVRSAILDSVVPVDTNLFSKYPEAIEAGLRTLFNDCASDPKCSAAYPDLESTFWDLVTELDANPITVTTSDYPSGTLTETVTGTTVMNIILSSIKNSYFISTAPQSIYRFKEGDFSTLVIAQSSLPFTFEGISPGLFISMMCHEHILTTSTEELQSASNRQIIKEFAWLPFYGDPEEIFKTCKSWGATGPVVGENDATLSDIPSLIITGAYDPTTPPMYGKQIAEELSNHYYFEFPNQGHTPTATDVSGCAMDIVLEFLGDPTTEPDRNCLNELKPIEFVVPYTGEPPLALETTRAYGINVDVPKDWRSLGEGYYYRGNSPFDITEVGILRLPASSEEIEEFFSLPAYGYRGLDSPLMPAGQRQTDEFTWNLFKSSSYGRPVDIAVVDEGGWSIVVVMFCNQDEHEALYQTVYLPILESASQ
jgi:pimeloyl-ACP methyl ester carboxylesterase